MHLGGKASLSAGKVWLTSDFYQYQKLGLSIISSHPEASRHPLEAAGEALAPP
jgi:hypothetical protein